MRATRIRRMIWRLWVSKKDAVASIYIYIYICLSVRFLFSLSAELSGGRRALS